MTDYPGPRHRRKSPILSEPGTGPLPSPRSAAPRSDAGAVTAGFDPRVLGGHSLKRGALTTGMDRSVHKTHLEQLVGHKSFAVLDDYLELGNPFDSHPLNGGL